MRQIVLLFCVIVVFVPFGSVLAQSASSTIVAGEVVSAGKVETQELSGLGVTEDVQMIHVEILNNAGTTDTVLVENDRGPLSVGDRVFLRQNSERKNVEYSVEEIDRRGAVYVALAIFILAVIALGGWQGVRSLVSLGFSIGAVVFLLLPFLLSGISPVLVSVGITAVVLAVAIFVTHGFNRNSVIAFSGTVVAVCIAGVLSLLAVWSAHLTGLGVDDAVFLNVVVEGAIDPRGLLLAGILIGMIGVLDDISITQVAVVSELRHANPLLSIREIYRRAMRVGREHVGALVNTLVLAYVGASLPLLLLLYNADAPLALVLSQEIFVTEIVRAIIGSIGLILAVPLTTFIASLYATGGTGHGHHH